MCLHIRRGRVRGFRNLPFRSVVRVEHSDHVTLLCAPRLWAKLPLGNHEYIETWSYSVFTESVWGVPLLHIQEVVPQEVEFHQMCLMPESHVHSGFYPFRGHLEMPSVCEAVISKIAT